MAVYKVEDLSFKYDKEYALKDVSFTVEEGDFVLLCGKSGCGKSTLLRLLKHSLAPAGEKDGSISFFDRDIQSVDGETVAKDIGFVLQNPDNQIVCDDVYGELCFGMSNLGFSRDDMNKRVFEVANYFGINNYLDVDISQLSGGQKQLLSVAAVLCQRPRVLLLDEPTANLDPNSTELLMSALERVNRELGITVIMSEQDLNDVYPVCSKVIAMDKGGVAFISSKRSIAPFVKDYENKEALPVYVRAYSEICGGDRCPRNMNEAKSWIKGFDKSLSIYKTDVSLSDDDAVLGKDMWLRFDKNGRDVLRGVNITVKKGELTCIFGANGSGKSTLFKALCGLKKCYDGKVQVVGSKALVSQNPLDVLSSSTIAGEFKDADNDILDVFEIKKLMDRHPYDLSGGEVKRVVLAKALMLETDILFLDEVTTGMGEYYKEKLAMVLKHRKKNGLSVILSSHDLEFCARHGDTCNLLFNGRIAAKGKVRDIIRDNEYYTTKARILAKDVWDCAVTDKDVIQLCRMSKEKQ